LFVTVVAAVTAPVADTPVTSTGRGVPHAPSPQPPLAQPLIAAMY